MSFALVLLPLQEVKALYMNRRLLHIILIAIGCVTWCIVTMAQDYAGMLERQRKMFPQEKVYVMTDRDLYLAGDTARMRAWIYDCNSRGVTTSHSKYVYVELRDAADNLRSRIKLMDHGKGMRGYIAMPPELTSGDYTLVAYTYYMLGTTEEMFFRKRLHVMNPKDISRGLMPNNVIVNDNVNDTQGKPCYDTGLQPYDTLRYDTPAATKTLNQRGDLNSLNLPIGSNVAMSITADRLCRADSTSSIVWSLEHQPDLFTLDDIKRSQRLYSPTMPYEVGQTISGTVYGNISTKKPQEGVRVSLVVPTKKITESRITGSDGRFEFSGFDLPDSTLVFISAKKGKRTRMENIKIDGDSLPERVSHLPAMPHYFKRESEVPSEMKIVSSTIDLANTQMLAEIEVRGQKREKFTETYQHFAERTMIADDLMKRGIYDLETALLHMPGVRYANGVLSYRGKPLRFFIDGIEEGYDPDDDTEGMPSVGSMVAMSYPMEIIERIDLLRPEDTAFLVGGSGGGNMAAVCITLKDGADIRKASRSAALKMVFPLGYQKYKKFNRPAADQAWPVIYWNSNITVKDKMTLRVIIGKVMAERKAKGDRGAYTVHIDGFSPDGKPLHVERTIR